MLEFEQIKKNYEKYVNFCRKYLNDDNKDAFERFIEDFGEKLIMCPASQRDAYHSSFPGGLVLHSINVLNMFTHTFIKNPSESELKTLVTISLLHDIGKLGTLEEDYYIESFDKWRNYTINENLKSLSAAHRTIQILNNYGFKLTDDEFTAILNSYLFIKEDRNINIFSLQNIVLQLAMSKVLTIKKEKQS